LSRYLYVLAHNLLVNINGRLPLTHKGERTYRCGSTFRKTLSLATCEIRGGAVQPSPASDRGGEPG